ncbi:YL1 nuclear protein [Dictyocaulus viviparus]|uniref:Vacuolar protein sorting-associated protein 72 homolog n=1 Tax=Dictyocaulus viviparus TaxID=29172 RepID=A0A0D8Y520_DICVI|nr:YL1 nuclear protein [Dictyocaulus viviparus]
MSGGDSNITEEKRSDAEESNSSDEISDDSSSDVEIELMVNARARRSNAGSKMSALIQSSNQEDDFYKSVYGGGFNEDDADDVFESPENSDVDEVDSDFDRPEDIGEIISDDESEEKQIRRKVKGSKRELLAKNKMWATARIAGKVVAANSVDAKTQAARLKEAEHTEKVNTESLRKYEQFELERKKKREHLTTRRRVLPPLISVKDTINETTLVVPDIKVFKKPEKKLSFVCSVTGRPARYRDPITNLPYSSPFAFKIIRDQYHKYLKTIKDRPDVTEYLKQFEL